MGMSAAQARLLSITTRLTNNEFRSQTITNSKLRLADKSSDASQEYMNALNSQQLMFGSYNSDGKISYQQLTPSVIMTFSDLKNQYGLINSAGKILVNGSDAKIYKNSSTLEEFLNSYNISQRLDSNTNSLLSNIYGEDYAYYYKDLGNRYNFYDRINNTSSSANSAINWINQAGSSKDADGNYLSNFSFYDASKKDTNGFYVVDTTDYTNWASQISTWKGNLGLPNVSTSAIFGSYLNAIENVPELSLPEKPVLEAKPAEPQQGDYQTLVPVPLEAWEKFKTACALGGCWDTTTARPHSGNHLEHIITHLLEPGQSYTTTWGATYTMKNDTNGQTSVAGQATSNWPAESETTAQEVRSILSSQDEIMQNIIDTYYNLVVAYGHASDASSMGISTSSDVYITEKDATTRESELKAYNTAEAEYQEALEEYNTAKEAYDIAAANQVEKQTAVDDINQAIRDINTAITAKEGEESTAATAFSTAEAAWIAAGEKYDGSDSTYVAYITAKNNLEKIQAELQELKDNKTAYSDELPDAQAALADAAVALIGPNAAYTSAQTTLTTKEAARDAAKQQYENKYVPTSKSSYTTDLDDRLANLVSDLCTQIENATYYEWGDDTTAFGDAHLRWEETCDEIETKNNAAIAKYNQEVEEYQKLFNQQLADWKKDIEVQQEKYKKALDEIANSEHFVPDETDSKYQWYVNLWYRMGGTSETTKSSIPNYQELDENLMNNSEWLQFALEHGIVTLEQAAFSEEGSQQYPKMGQFDWKSMIYTNASDISLQDDSVAIARAEVKYNNAMREIENQDKKFDQDLKKLDTEHSALQTEYESVKSVIDKNVERSFKAFS